MGWLSIIKKNLKRKQYKTVEKRRMPIDYTKSKIYKIVCNETGETYYGSTTQTLSRRLAGHKTDVKNRIKPCSSKQIMERGNYDIVLCEECPCENKERLHAIERKWIEENECVNKNIPSRTTQENKEYKKKYNESHKQELKQYYEVNRKKIRQYQKEYYQGHKEELKQYQNQYQQAQKLLK
jgi:hypothetical protein